MQGSQDRAAQDDDKHGALCLLRAWSQVGVSEKRGVPYFGVLIIRILPI